MSEERKGEKEEGKHAAEDWSDESHHAEWESCATWKYATVNNSTYASGPEVEKQAERVMYEEWQVESIISGATHDAESRHKVGTV